MKKVAKKTAKYVTESTFEKHMGNIAKSFARVDASLERHEKVLEEILKQFKNMNEESRYFRASISNLYGDVSKQDRTIANFDIRMEKIELKVK